MTTIHQIAGVASTDSGRVHPSETSARPLFPINGKCAVAAHMRKKPYADRKAAMTARLLAEVEARVDREISAAFRTFALNTKRAFMAGRI